MSALASQLLLLSLLALAAIWAVRHITSAPRADDRSHFTTADLVWHDHALSDDEQAWEQELKGADQ